jgi:hypothetical protein
MKVHIKLPEVVHTSFRNIVSQFTPLLWVTVIMTMIVLTLLLSATWYAGIYCNHHEELVSYRLCDTWLYTFGIICQQGKVLSHLLLLNCVELYCLVLYCMVLFCVILCCVALYCVVLYCTVLCSLCYIVLCCVVLCCRVRQSLLTLQPQICAHWAS